MNKITTTFLAISILIISSIEVYAQDEKKLTSGNSLNIVIPQGKLAETYDHGFGVYANFDYQLNKILVLRADFGWNDVSGPETSYVDLNGVVHTNHPNRSIWEFSAGLKARISIFYLEARGGYFSGVNQWGVVPAVGIRIGKVDLQGNYALLGDYEWASARLGYYWGK